MNKRWWLVVVLMAIGLPVQAHTLTAPVQGFMAGLWHPFLGLDHLLALSAVAVWAHLQRGRLVWRVPLVFMAALAMASLLASMGLALPVLETGLAVSVLVLGLLGATAARASTLGLVLIAVFGVLHGAAHGMEMPLTVTAWSYLLGILSGSAIILGITRLFVSAFGSTTMRVSGALMAAGGAALLALA